MNPFTPASTGRLVFHEEKIFVDLSGEYIHKTN
jgi:hypothetical protein